MNFARVISLLSLLIVPVALLPLSVVRSFSLLGFVMLAATVAASALRIGDK